MPAERTGTALAVLVIAGLTLRTMQLRRRARRLSVLPGATGQGPSQGWCLVTAPGVRVGEETVRAATRHAENYGLRALDLIPAELSAEDALTLLGDLDPSGYRTNRDTAGRTAGHAMVLREDLARQVGVAGPVSEADDPIEFLRLALRVKDRAPTGVDLVVVPGLRAVRGDPAWAVARLRVIPMTVSVPMAMAWPVLVAAVLGAVAVAAPVWGGLSALLLWIRPALVFGRGAVLRPPRTLAGLPLRPVRFAGGWTRAVAHRSRRSPHEPPPPDLAAARREYAALVADGLGQFFEPRRDDCPWCGSADLVVQARVGDLLQGKPGRFTLERCGDCGHVFQNPRLSLAGLDYYYRDFYAGLGASATAVMDHTYHAFRDRAAMLRPFTDPPGPKAWLDVGGGAGHFCQYARDMWPETVFDALDMSESVLDGQRLGRVDTGHVGQFPDLAASLAGRYEVVSMFHYLEHTRDPRAELAVAARVLGPGGHLLIEVPNPRSPLRHLFRSWWVCWFQPQHQHFVPLGNLRDALAEEGFTVIAAHGDRVHVGGEFLAAVAFAHMKLVPRPDRPWDPREPGRARRAWHRATKVVATPLFAVALILEFGTGVLVRRTGGGDAYRVLARRQEGPS